jgi:hypothetical protein
MWYNVDTSCPEWFNMEEHNARVIELLEGFLVGSRGAEEFDKVLKDKVKNYE